MFRARARRCLPRFGVNKNFGTSKEERFLALIGASGSGKSSLALAGLSPSIQRGELPASAKWPLVRCAAGVDFLSFTVTKRNSSLTAANVNCFRWISRLILLADPYTETRGMSDPEEYQVQFDEAFDGAYLYLDRCGEFMGKVRNEFGFVPLSANPSSCIMESPEIALQLQASGDAMVLTCTNPKFVADLLKAAKFCTRAASELFEPFAVEHYRLVSRSIWRTATMEESFKRSLEITSSSIESFAELLQVPALNQDLLYSYQSGTRRVHLHLNPTAFNVTPIERKVPLLGTPKGYRDYLIKKERSIQQSPAQPGYGLALEITVIESEPVLERGIDNLYEILLDYKKRILNHLKK